MLIIRRLLLILAALLLTWRAIVNGVTAHYLDRPDHGDPDVSRTLAIWGTQHPEVTLQQALNVIGVDNTAAAASLIETYANNPSDTRPLWAIAEIAQQNSDLAKADSLVTLITQLHPASSRAHQRASAYWASRDDLKRALQHWDLAMRADRSSEQSIFPMLQKIAQNAELRPALRPYTEAPSPWWERFFSHLALNSSDIDSIRSLYSLRNQSSSQEPSKLERRVIIRSLRESGRIAEAYIIWVNGLNDSEREQLGWLNNGSFELAPTNIGFDWHVIPTENVFVDTSNSDTVDGQYALHLKFSGIEEKYAGLYQPLFLDPGRYQASGSSKSEGIGSRSGTRWSVQCLKPHTRHLGLSKPLNITSNWGTFAFDFEVPADCSGQILRLISTDDQTSGTRLKRELWLDHIAIKQARPEQKPLHTETE